MNAVTKSLSATTLLIAAAAAHAAGPGSVSALHVGSADFDGTTGTYVGVTYQGKNGNFFTNGYAEMDIAQASGIDLSRAIALPLEADFDVGNGVSLFGKAGVGIQRYEVSGVSDTDFGVAVHGGVNYTADKVGLDARVRVAKFGNCDTATDFSVSGSYAVTERVSAIIGYRTDMDRDAKYITAGVGYTW